MVLLAVTMTILAGGVAPSPALQPVGPWQVNAKDGTCTVTRQFGDPGKGPVFGLRSYLASPDRLNVLFESDDPKSGPNEQLVVADAAAPESAVSADAELIAGEARSTRRLASMDRPGLQRLADGRSLWIEYGQKGMVVVRPAGFPKALDALAACERDVVSRRRQRLSARRPG